MSPAPAFDSYAETYASALQEGLSLSGESAEFFARGRIAWLRAQLDALGMTASQTMDFGCGTGSAAPLLRDVLGARALTGIDVSEKSLEVARRMNPWADFRHRDQSPSPESFDVVYCNGVFHHIPPRGRPEELEFIRRALRPGGVLALWENNPWNPGTRLVMRRISFDRDAVTISPPGARAMLRKAGFDVVRIDSLFFFPHFLRALRRFEPALSRLPFGGQYLTLATRPARA